MRVPKRLPAVAVAAVITAVVLALAAACGGGSDEPGATPTPQVPGPLDAIAEWVRANRNVDFVGECRNAEEGIDVGKLCAQEVGRRGTRLAFSLGPTFSEPTALAIIDEAPEGATVLSVENINPNDTVPGIAWPLQVGDRVIVIGLGEGDCLRIREQPTQQGAQITCIADGAEAVILDGPVDAETFTWWQIAGEGFTGWAAGTWLRLPEAIAQALASPTPVPDE
jgi:hypothetical protein